MFEFIREEEFKRNIEIRVRKVESNDADYDGTVF